jgi:hypothetical protein
LLFLYFVRPPGIRLLAESAVQALSVDDARAAFEPRLWEDHPNVEQVWFSGVHANVGGGYPKQGMVRLTEVIVKKNNKAQSF